MQGEILPWKEQPRVPGSFSSSAQPVKGSSKMKSTTTSNVSQDILTEKKRNLLSVKDNCDPNISM